MKKIFVDNLISKDKLKQKIDSEIKRKKEMRKVYMYKKIALGFCVIASIGIGTIILINNNKKMEDSKNKEGDQVTKIILERKLMKSAEYNIAVYNELDEYIDKNINIEELNSGKTEIKTEDIISNNIFTTCSGVVTLEMGESGEYTYTVASNCTDDESGGAELIIKKYDGINKLGSGDLFDLVKVDDGYIGLFGVISNEQLKDNTCQTRKSVKDYSSFTTTCTSFYDGYKIVKIDSNGKMTDIDVVNGSIDVDYSYIRPTNIIETKDGYYVETFGSNNSNQISGDVNYIAKYNKNFEREWLKEFDSRKYILLFDDKIALRSNGGEDADKLILLDSNGDISKEIKFEIENNQYLGSLLELVYSNGYFYSYKNSSAEDYVEDDNYANKLYKFDSDGKMIFSKILDNYEPIENGVTSIHNTTNQIIIKGNNTINLYDLDANYLNSYNFNRATNSDAYYVENIIVEDDKYTIVMKNGFNFIIDSYNKDGAILKSDYSNTFDIDAINNSKGSRYIATSNDLVKYNYSSDNDGSLTMLVFK